jgi:hypothetical protein
MKAINAKIPLSVAQLMDNNAQLNPQFLSTFITKNLLKPCPDQPVESMAFNYTFKIDTDIHNSVKIKAQENNLPVTEFLGRLLKAYY